MRDITSYINPVAAAEGCGLGADVISAYSAYNFLLPGVIGYYRQQNGGIDPTDELFLASFPGGNAGTARCFLKKMIPGAFNGEYRLADIINSPVQWNQLDRAGQPVRMRLSSTVIQVAHLGRPGFCEGCRSHLCEGRQALPRARESRLYARASSTPIATSAAICPRRTKRP